MRETAPFLGEQQSEQASTSGIDEYKTITFHVGGQNPSNSITCAIYTAKAFAKTSFQGAHTETLNLITWRAQLCPSALFSV